MGFEPPSEKGKAFSNRVISGNENSNSVGRKFPDLSEPDPAEVKQDKPSVWMLGVELIITGGLATGLWVCGEHFGPNGHPVLGSTLNFFSATLFFALLPLIISKKWSPWIVWPCYCVCILGLGIVWLARPHHPSKTALGNDSPGAWLPPELPENSTNVVVSFGGLAVTVPTTFARISNDKEGTKFLLKDLPPEMLTGVDKLTNYSPRNRNLWIRRENLQFEIGGKKIDLPISPYVISNRLFIKVRVPFKTEQTTIIMSDDLDSQLPFPRLWDRNYNSNMFEVVNEATNPVLQVVYRRPNEVQVNGVFIVDHYDLLETFGGAPLLLSPHLVLADNTKTQELNIEEISKQFTNLTIAMDTNAAYGITFTDQKALFRYPSWRYPGVPASQN